MILARVSWTYRCYFVGGDANDRFELVDWRDTDSGLINGRPAEGIMRGPGASVYRRTTRTVCHRGRLWTVWEHCGGWVPYRPINTDT